MTKHVLLIFVQATRLFFFKQKKKNQNNVTEVPHFRRIIILL